jgi:PAS domain S-box-containing protein
MTMNVPDRKREGGFAIRTGLPWLVLFLGATVVLLIAGYTYYTHEAERIRNENYEDLASVVNLKIDAIVMWRKQRLHDVWILANSPFERDALSEWLPDQSNSILQKALQDRFVLEQQTRGYADILLFDLDGNMLLSAKPNPEPLSPAEREAVQETLTQGSARLSNLYGSSSDGIIQLAAVAPVLSQGGKALAVAVMRSNAESLLYPLIRSWPTLSRTSETLLVCRDGDEVLCLNQVRRRPNSPLTFRHALDPALPDTQAILGKEGLFEGKDYRGEEVLAHLDHIPDSQWFMVAQVDKNEILEGAHFRGLIAALFAGALILVVGAGSAYGYRNRQATMYKDLYKLEQERRLIEERYRTILYSIGDAVITTDTGTLVQQMNPVAERLTGWTEDEGKGKTIDEILRIVNEKPSKPGQNPVQRVLTEGTVVEWANDTLLISRDGAERSIAYCAAPIRQDGAISGVVLLFRDQTEQKAVRIALEESEAKVLSVFESASDGIISFDDQGTIEMVNPATETLFGYTTREIVGKDVKLFMPKLYSSEQDQPPKPQSKTFETGVTERTRNTIAFRKDGGTFPVEISVSEYSNKHGGHSAVLVRDITERVTAEGDRAFLAAIVESSDEAIIGKNLEGTIVSWNREAEKMYGLTAEEAKGQSILAIVPPRLHPQVIHLLEMVIRGERTENLETTRLAKDGREIPVLLSVFPIRDSFGKILGVSSIARNISETKRYEHELRQGQKDIASSEAANRAKSEFLASMSHELRTPLNSVIGFSEVLHDKTFGDLNAKQVKYVDNILIAARHLLSLINDILDLAKIEARKTDLRCSDFNVGKLLEECLLLVREKALNRNLDISLHTQDDLMVWADERSLKQIILNLLSNATKFTPDGGKLSVTAEKKQDELVFSVRDNGIGVRPEDQERIFNEFEQIDSGTARKYQGTGLGLALTRKLVELHGGRIWIESEGEGRGSVFSFTIPCASELTGKQFDGMKL